jgi:hypothetical protein
MPIVTMFPMKDWRNTKNKFKNSSISSDWIGTYYIIWSNIKEQWMNLTYCCLKVNFKKKYLIQQNESKLGIK